MNEIETKTSDGSELSALKTQCSALSRQVNLLILALFLVSGTVTAYLWLQARWLGKNIEAVRPQARQAAEASAKEMPVVTAFVTKLTEYGRTHTNFQPFIVRYGLGATNTNPFTTTGQE
jgi:hypothetical protein